MIRVLVADDQQLQRLAFRMLVECEPGMAVAGEHDRRDGRPQRMIRISGSGVTLAGSGRRLSPRSLHGTAPEIGLAAGVPLTGTSPLTRAKRLSTFTRDWLV
jgi:hypothetical protein